MLKIAEIV